MADAAAQAYAARLLDGAKALDTEKEGLQKRIGANRDALRNMATAGDLSADQVKAVEKLYPKRERKGKNTPAA